MRTPLVSATVVLALAMAASAGAASGPRLQAGVGRADITPPQTGYFLGGWTRADRLARGQSTRLFANALSLRRGSTRLVLVAVELFAVPAGLQEDVARAVADLGYTIPTVVMAASHTHSGPGGFANNPTYNTAAPSMETVSDPATFYEFLDPKPADRQLYRFLVDQIVQAIRRADRDLAPAAAGWGHARLTGVTQNRSLEAHLANHGLALAFGTGTVAMDPDGAGHTIDPDVDVLRVDKLVRRRGRLVHVPIGGYSSFADHGTVVKAPLGVYSGDHHAAAARVFAQLVRRAGRTPARQLVVNVYPNGDEGDQTAGITHSGPAGADEVGRAEAQAMFSAWRAARRTLSRRPAIALRWTRACFCGRDTATGPVATTGYPGAPFFTGSEEGRGPLFDVTGVPFEGQTSPVDDPEQGDKIVIRGGSFPPAIPLSILRVGSGAIATIPGEPTKEMGARVKPAVLAALAGRGVGRVMIGGLANDYVQYLTTPEEYGRQHYEGGSTLYGPNTATFVQERLVELARALAAGAQAPAPVELDTSYGVHADGPVYPPGAASGAIAAQPDGRVARLGHARVSWTGAPAGRDRPVDAAFVRAQRRDRAGRWRTVDDDLGLAMLWRVDDAGRYDATWEVPLSAPTGTYRFLISAARYRLVSAPFTVAATRALRVAPAAAASGRAGLTLGYPPPRVDVDLTARPRRPDGRVRVRVGGRALTARRGRDGVFSVRAPAGASVVVPAGWARDRYGNSNEQAVTLR